ncbi:MAG: EH signature domain-containing protein [Devosia sp.]
MSHSLRDAIVHLGQRLSLGERPVPENPPLARLAAKLVQDGGTTERRPPKDFDAVAGEILAQLQSGVQLDTRQLRDAAWCLWTTNPAIADQPREFGALLLQMQGSDSARPFRTLATSFMASYTADQAGNSEAAQVLGRLSQQWGGPWGQVHQAYQLFDLSSGPQALAAAVIAQDKPASDILKAAGIGAISAQSGYAKAITGALLDQLAQGRDMDHLTRLARIQRYAMTPEGNPIYGDQRPNLVEALLRPFGTGTVEKAVRDLFLKIVLSLMGDPRLKPGNWSFVPTALREMVQRWLTEQSLRQFLDIVDRTADDGMWRYRRAFWEGVYDRGMIGDAWVAFGPDGHRMAKSVFGKSAEFAVLASEGRQVESGHAVLLLRIGNGVVADWSHNGKCNIWSSADSKTAPKLFKKTYGSDEIRIHKGTGNYETEDLLSLMHMSSPTYNWQGKVAERLRKMTGIRLQQSDYRWP